MPARKPPVEIAPPIVEADLDFWEWDSLAGGYRPHSTHWWVWDPDAQVMRPIAENGWTFDPRIGRGTWVHRPPPLVIVAK
jgi:hypothetical protein